MNDYPEGHPLHDVPDEILAAARRVMVDAAQWQDFGDPELAYPLADAVVISLLPWLQTGESAVSVLRALYSRNIQRNRIHPAELLTEANRIESGLNPRV